MLIDLYKNNNTASKTYGQYYQQHRVEDLWPVLQRPLATMRTS